MTSDLCIATARLTELLTEALTIADTIDQPIAAIHIAEALSQIAPPTE